MAQVDAPPPIPGGRGRCWLQWPNKFQSDNREPIQWSHRGGPRGEIVLRGLTPPELEAIEGCLIGTSYIRCIDGRLWAYDVYEALPSPEADSLIGPHWGATGEPKLWGGLPDGEGWHSPGLIITALGAGCGDSRSRRQRNIEIATEFGFQCLRSQRGRDGKYWEQWVLHFLDAARGRLREHLDALPKEDTWDQRANAAARFVAEHVAFGSLDITIQRWALSCD